MTIDELNALYEAADFGNLGNYKAPTTTSNIDLVEGIPAIQPYIPPIIQNEGGGKGPTEDPFIDPMSFGQNDILGYNQLNIAGPVKGQGIQGLIDLYQKFSPMANIMKLGKTGIETAQKYFADKKETERLEALAQIEQARKQKEAQATIAAAEEQAAREAATATRAMAANPNVYRNAGITSGGFASQNTGTNQGFSNKSGRGRTGYGKGGIVTL